MCLTYTRGLIQFSNCAGLTRLLSMALIYVWHIQSSGFRFLTCVYKQRFVNESEYYYKDAISKPTSNMILNRLEKYSKTCVNGHSKIDKTKILMTYGSLMKVQSIAECSPWGMLPLEQSTMLLTCIK